MTCMASSNGTHLTTGFFVVPLQLTLLGNYHFTHIHFILAHFLYSTEQHFRHIYNDLDIFVDLRFSMCSFLLSIINAYIYLIGLIHLLSPKTPDIHVHCKCFPYRPSADNSGFDEVD